MGNPAYQKLKDTNLLPSPAGVAIEILRLASDDKSTLQQIADVVQSDPALAARLLKLVNSPFAGVGRKVASIKTAVNMIGLRSVKNLALSLSLVAHNRHGRCAEFDYEAFWQESLARAVAAKHLATFSTSFIPDEMFTIGLLSKIGCLALATVFPKEYGVFLTRSAMTSPADLLKLEQEAFGIDHQQLSSEMMIEWRLHEIFCEAIRNQGKRESAPESRTAQFGRLLSVASLFATVITETQPREDSLKAIASKAEAFGIPEASLDALFDTIVQDWRETGTIFSVPTREVPPLSELRDQNIAPLTVREEICPLNDPLKRSNRQEHPLHILVVDDDATTRNLVERYLTLAGYRVTVVASAAEALEVDRREAPQLIITDWVMPSMDGLELCRQIRSNDRYSWVFLLVLTIRTEKGRELEALEAGADDFLGKPFNRAELLAHVRVGERIIRLESNLAERSREIARYNARLSVANDKLRTLATTDELTGLINRREALARLHQQWAIAQRYNESLCCIVADIDYFKNFNDIYGHSTGDAVLQTTASKLKQSVRSTDIVARYGGEEFLILCPRSTLTATHVACERMRNAVTTNTLTADGTECTITASFGIAERLPDMNNPLDLLKAADHALYAAKQAGRNRVCVYEPLQDDSIASPPTTEINGTDLKLLRTDSGPPATVLVVDDDPHIRKLCRHLLEREGCTVLEAADGQIALKIAATGTPEIIVLDMMMPELDGLECTRRLKADPLTRKIPVLILSAAQTESIESALACGADEFISKPFRQNEFILRIRALTKLFRSKIELNWSNETRWEQARTLQVVHDLSRNLLEIENIDQILDRCISAAADLTHGRTISIMLPDSTGEYLSTVMCLGMDDASKKALIPIGHDIPGRVFLSGKSVVADGIESVLPEVESSSLFYKDDPFICEPLRSADKIIGVMNVVGRHGNTPFLTSEIESLRLLCNVTASAINDYMNRKALIDAQNALSLRKQQALLST